MEVVLFFRAKFIHLNNSCKRINFYIPTTEGVVVWCSAIVCSLFSAVIVKCECAHPGKVLYACAPCLQCQLAWSCVCMALLATISMATNALRAPALAVCRSSHMSFPFELWPLVGHQGKQFADELFGVWGKTPNWKRQTNRRANKQKTANSWNIKEKKTKHMKNIKEIYSLRCFVQIERESSRLPRGLPNKFDNFPKNWDLLL